MNGMARVTATGVFAVNLTSWVVCKQISPGLPSYSPKRFFRYEGKLPGVYLSDLNLFISSVYHAV